MQTLYEQIGGAETIDSLVDKFYSRVLDDPLLSPFFANTTMDKQRKMQKAFLSIALDGPVVISDISLYAAHQGRGIEREHLTRFTEHLLNTLKEIGVDEHHANQVLARIATYADEVLGEGYADG